MSFGGVLAGDEIFVVFLTNNSSVIIYPAVWVNGWPSNVDYCCTTLGWCIPFEEHAGRRGHCQGDNEAESGEIAAIIRSLELSA